tara:strand:+ start:2682 stop:3389 length:708 start_codon:yes stop_codon:yes gene_type:complete
MVFKSRPILLCVTTLLSASGMTSLARADIESGKAIPFNPERIIRSQTPPKAEEAYENIEPEAGKVVTQDDIDMSKEETEKRTIIQDGDLIVLNIQDESDLTGQYEIDYDGNINLPLIGSVSVLGQEITDITAAITSRLQDGFIHKPIVSIDFKPAEPIYIIGEVANPGAYKFSSNLTPIKAAALAGGFSDEANQDYFELIENANKDRAAPAAIKMVPYFKVLKPGDTIRVKKQVF